MLTVRRMLIGFRWLAWLRADRAGARQNRQAPTRHNSLMAQVVLFHSAYGLRQAEASAAALLGAAAMR